MRNVVLAGLAGLLAGCPVETLPCGPFEEVFVWVDEDGDGFGGVTALGYTCEPKPNEATNNVDCDDTLAAVNPGIEEACDLVDNDCDGSVDEALPFTPWYQDADGDGYGDTLVKEVFCMPPGPEWTDLSGDCNDVDPAINPLALEVCDAGIDNDCDGAADDADGGLDPSSTTRWYQDGDGDGYGSDDLYVDACVTPNPYAVSAGGDCADSVPTINPGALEQCNPAIDENCNGLIDDDDPYIDPDSQDSFHADVDADGFGDPNVIVLACLPAPGVGVVNDLDCDDADAEATVDQNWYEDTDYDGVGGGDPVAFQCVRPAGVVEPEANGIDCEPDDPNVYPGNNDPCEDGVDSDCDTLDTCRSCKHWQDTLGLGALDGAYEIEPSVGNHATVWCDQTIDDGGWTLVLSSADIPPNDAGTTEVFDDIARLNPQENHKTSWMGLRPVVQQNGDIRFACRIAGSQTFDVDLSFYDNHWYWEITEGLDSLSCFNENEGIGADFPPARRDNISGVYLALGNQWAAGYLEGEDRCGDKQDFMVDFDDRGMDGVGGVLNDGTEWGESNGAEMCTGPNKGDAWFIFVREN